MQFDQYPEAATIEADDILLIYDVSDNAVKRVTQRRVVGIADFGWTPTGETWTYASFDSATRIGVVTVPVGALTKYSPNMRVRLSQAATLRYARITEVTASSLKLFFGSEYALDNAVIVEPVYSSLLVPFGYSSLPHRPWWEEIGRTTLTAAGDTLAALDLPVRKYLHVLITGVATGGTIDLSLRFNNDATANAYVGQYTVDNGANTTTSATSFPLDSTTTATGEYADMQILNVSGIEKILQFTNSKLNTAGGGINVSILRASGKWANTAQITRIDVINSGTGDLAIGSEIVVLGHD